MEIFSLLKTEESKEVLKKNCPVGGTSSEELQNDGFNLKGKSFTDFSTLLF